MIRKPIAITTVAEKLVALHSDGTIWKQDATGDWTRISLAPQPRIEKTCQNCVFCKAGHKADSFRCWRFPPMDGRARILVEPHHSCGEFDLKYPEK